MQFEIGTMTNAMLYACFVLIGLLLLVAAYFLVRGTRFAKAIHSASVGARATASTLFASARGGIRKIMAAALVRLRGGIRIMASNLRSWFSSLSKKGKNSKLPLIVGAVCVIGAAVTTWAIALSVEHVSLKAVLWIIAFLAVSGLVTLILKSQAARDQFVKVGGAIWQKTPLSLLFAILGLIAFHWLFEALNPDGWSKWYAWDAFWPMHGALIIAALLLAQKGPVRMLGQVLAAMVSITIIVGTWKYLRATDALPVVLASTSTSRVSAATSEPASDFKEMYHHELAPGAPLVITVDPGYRADWFGEEASYEVTKEGNIMFLTLSNNTGDANIPVSYRLYLCTAVTPC
jgi:hypothetical protein